MVIVTAFPAPNASVEHAMNMQRVARTGDADDIAKLGDVDTLPKPWEPASCPDELRHQLWLWLDLVVAWINHDYVWRSTDLIPDCWPQHPHIASELAVIACKRVVAGDAHTPEQLDDWHRHVLPDFLDRIALRLGDGGCRAGKHTDWPAAGRHHQAVQPGATQFRRETFFRDTHPFSAVPDSRQANRR
jgi:hypothetical protein